MEKLVHIPGLTNLPLSSNQKRLWIIYQHDKLNPAYNIPMIYHLRGELNINVFKKSLDLIFERHYTLFSIFKQKNGEPYIEILPRPLHLELVDFSGLTTNNRKETILSFAGENSRKCFDIEQGPLYRLQLLKENNTSYYFHMTFQHMIFDAWSLSIMVKELGQIYTGISSGNDITLDPLRLHSYDFAAWENKSGIGKDETELIEFWRENLKDCPTELKFPYDYPRKNIPTGLGYTIAFTISEVTTAKLREIAKKRNSTPFKTVLSILGIMIHKYTGEDDICIGVPVSNRRTFPNTYDDSDNIQGISNRKSLPAFQAFGLFVNTAVVRFKINIKNTFSEYLDYTKEVTNKALQHSGLPFDKIVGIVKPERIPGMNPFFQISLSWINNLSVPIEMGDATGRWITKNKGVSPFDITFYMWENNGVIEGEIEYATDLLSHKTILRLKENFLNLINLLTDNQDVAIESLSMISEEELKMIDTTNSTFTAFPKDKTILQLIEERAIIDPEKTALIFDDCKLSYGELNSKAIQLAGVLQSHNIGPGDFVGLLLKRSPELIICLLAIFKSGAAYVPLNLTDPDNRIKSIIEAADIKFVITNEEQKLELTDNRKRLDLEQLIDKSENMQTTFKNIPLNATDPAYIIFTSGTTGTPKGVLVNHRSVVNLIDWVNNTFKISGTDKLLWITNLSFDLSVYDIFGILVAGGIVRILSDEDRQNPKKQYDILLNEGITFWDSAPQSLVQLTPFFNRIGESRLYESLRLVFLSGDWIPLSLPETITSVFHSASVVGLGGATEATVWSNYFLIDQINPEWKSIPYGKPIQNARYYILNDKMCHCRIREPGNLYIGGECLALGYYNDPALTNSKFIPDPYNDGSRLYLTGDKAQWMCDGNIEFLGREDEQLKIRGYRVEIGEIKDKVLQNKAIKEAVIIPDKSDRHNIKVILFITTYDGKELDVRDLKKEMRERLPEYMIPSEIMHYTEFPSTPNGKIDSKALFSDYLRSLEDNQNRKLSIDTEINYKTMSPTQKVLFDIWGEALDTANISSTDNFFDIGGNSLLAIRLINNIKERTGFELSFREFLDNPTISQSGDYIDSQHSTAGEQIKLVHLTDTKNLPLTRNQKRLWLISKLQPDKPSYIIGFTYKLLGSLDHKIFQKSIKLLFERHHIIFSVVKEIDGEPYCDIKPSEVEVKYFDFSELSEEEKGKKVDTIIVDDSRYAFNLQKGPLFRLFLLKTSAEVHYFHLNIHHIVFDGWSWPILVNELKSIYHCLLRGEDIILEDIEFQQYDYAYWEKNSLSTTKENELIEFWKENLKDSSPSINFPYDFQCTGKTSGRGSFVPIRLSSELSNKLRTLSKTEGTSLFTTLMCVYGIQMHKYSGDDDLNIGLPVAHRPHSKLEKIFGMFVNTVVIRLRYPEKITFRELIHQTDEAALNAIEHQDLPFEKVVEIVNPERDSHINPLFQVAFVWQNNLDASIELDGIQSEKISVREGTNPFGILMTLWENGEIIEGEIAYSTDLLTLDTTLRMRNNFFHLIQALVKYPDMPVGSLSMVSAEDKKLIEKFSGSYTTYPKNRTIVDLFREQVCLYPNKTAVVYKGSSLTYKQLNERSNQLARRLRDSGVVGKTSVGLLLEKSLDLIVGIIGILKSGGVYVPIDPEYPADRIKFMISDAKCKILITQNDYMNIGDEDVLIINIDSPTSYHTDKADIEQTSNSSDPAYIMYTSGTTGVPKGSMIQQYSVVRLVRNTNYIDLTPDDRILLTGAIVFDATTFEIWGALLNGGTLYLAEKEAILNPRALGEELLNNDITILWLTSPLFTQIAESRTDIFGSLKYLLVGGDVLSATHINKVRKENPKLKVLNGYGPTENTTFSTTYLIDRDYEGNIPIGKPISNSTAYIFDRYMNMQPIGVVGELYVGGDGLSKGYLNRDDLNEKSFVDNPYNPGERLYKTGDFARWLPDGNIEFHGRMDNQLKIRGFRVELGEVEAVISELEGVMETVIKPVKVEEGDLRLAAFLNVSESFNMDIKDLNVKIKEKLPQYMVPSAFKIMHGFPKTVNGKIDRDALVLDKTEVVTRGSEDIKSLSSTERKILDIWSEVLRTKDILVTDNFFEIGGNSLLAITVMSKIESAFETELGLRLFFDSPKIKDLAETVDIEKKKLIKFNSENNRGKSRTKMIEGEI